MMDSNLFGSRTGEVWFTGDWHLGHRRILELCDRPFGDVHEMAEELIDRHNAMVESNDLVWMLGDMFMGDVAAGLALLSRIKGRKILVAGNHDRAFHGYAHESARSRTDWAARYREAGFLNVVTGSAMLRRDGRPVRIPLGPQRRPVLVSHFPYQGDTQDHDRFAAYRPKRPRTGSTPWLLHAHVHAAWQINGHQINVGVDAWNYGPTHAEVIAGMIEDAEGGPEQ